VISEAQHYFRCSVSAEIAYPTQMQAIEMAAASWELACMEKNVVIDIDSNISRLVSNCFVINGESYHF
jgi:hypothetical protein